MSDTGPHFAAVVNAFAKDDDVTSGRMFAAMGLKVRGKIFAMHVKGALVVKLPRERVDGIVRVKQGVPFDPGHGRVMKEWVSVAGHEGMWLALAREARDFVGESAPATAAGGRSSGRRARGKR